MFFTDSSVKRQITDSISENLTDLDLESREYRKKSYLCEVLIAVKTFFWESKTLP